MIESGLTNEQILSGIQSSEGQVIRWLYSYVYPSVKHFIIEHGGTNEDAHDVIQDALLVLYQRISGDHFSPEGEITDYLFGICRNLWMKRSRKHRAVRIAEKEAGRDLSAEYPLEERMELSDEELRRALLLKYFNRLEEICRKILTYFFQGMGYDRIQKKIPGYRLSYLPKKKQKCLEKLIRQIREDPGFSE